jgi:hypothetical protein
MLKLNIPLYSLNINKNDTMATITNTTGTKAVNISTDATGTIRAMYVQIYNGEQQVLQAKSFSSVRNAEKWANKIIN